ncbi:L-lysine-8-amino-7-oxononanoate aminotransferase [Halomonas elongata]|uniref:L-lysine-8-amino-7-oxononanoate aminotransferase n=1 Tax=Halomonas elongata TaxID=2746 RepID=A0A1B8P7A2_HALEL|nr:L-lysine-8-amino-7-oxononanoate aminotransferase [Halomonas elongata]
MTSQNASAQFDKQEIWQKDRDHFMHPWTDFSTFKETGSMVFHQADGVSLQDADGKRYLDGIGGLWCVNIGYGRDEIADAVAEQIRDIPYFSTFGHHTTAPAARLAAKLADLAPGDLNHVFYGCGGSVANDTAVRMIHFYFNQLGQTCKKQIISRKDGYHGSTYMAMSITGVEADHIGFDIDRQLVHHISCPNPTAVRKARASNPSATPRSRSWRTRFSSWGRTTWPPSSPSRSWAPAASSCRPRATTGRPWRCAASTTSSTSPTRWSPPSAAWGTCSPPRTSSASSRTSSPAPRV